jgi:hypothetical protein
MMRSGFPRAAPPLPGDGLVRAAREAVEERLAARRRLPPEIVTLAARTSKAMERGAEAHCALAAGGPRPDLALERDNLLLILGGQDVDVASFLDPTHRGLAAIFVVMRGLADDIPHMHDLFAVIEAAGLGPETAGYFRGVCGYRRAMTMEGA